MFRGRLLRAPKKYWECPSCGRRAVTQQTKPHTEMHPCPALKGLLTPMAEAEQAAKVVHRVKEWDDYVGDELVRFDGEGRPISSVSIERPDGSNDLWVFAPTARGGAGI